MEDLLPFSDEGLIRAVAACRTPVVSAIGHESDSPILDLVADYRASTPTDAAKRVVPDVADEKARVQQARHRMVQAVSRLVGRQQELLDGLRSRPVLMDPTATFGRRYEQLADAQASRESGHWIDDRPRIRPGRAPPGTDTRDVAAGHAGSWLLDPAGPERRRGPIGGSGQRRRRSFRTAGRRTVGGQGDAAETARRSMTDPAAKPETLSYEQARDELVIIVQRLESGGASLEESLALWERGEQLAAICQAWLDGAKAKVDAARARDAAPTTDESLSAVGALVSSNDQRNALVREVPGTASAAGAGEGRDVRLQRLVGQIGGHDGGRGSGHAAPATSYGRRG